MNKGLVVADYAIGDIQGCYQQLLQLLDKINFDTHNDRLWLVGDLVNRGPQSLDVLRFVQLLAITPVITLGNHDLHLLARAFGRIKVKQHDDSLDDILSAPDGLTLCHFLRKQKVLHHDKELNVVMTHAGIAPCWDLDKAKLLARELEKLLQGDDYLSFFDSMYGNLPDIWSDDLTGCDRLRLITNYFTRMRFCYPDGRLNLSYKGTIANAPKPLIPWFKVPNRKRLTQDVVFGHWAALQGQVDVSHLHAIDTGCLWGGDLTALRLQDKKRFTVAGLPVYDT